MVIPLASRPFLAALVAIAAAPTAPVAAQSGESAPLRQSRLTAETATHGPLTLRDASRNDRWLGLGVRDVRWSPDGSGVYFRWNRAPSSDDVPEEDPWFFAAADGSRVTEVADSRRDAVPGAEVVWSQDRTRAVWVRDGAVHVFSEGVSRQVAVLDSPARDPRFTGGGGFVDFRAGTSLYRYDVAAGSLARVAARVSRSAATPRDAELWLARQQEELFRSVRREQDERARDAAARRRWRSGPQPIPVPEGVEVEDIQLSPDGRWVTFVAREVASARPPTRFVDYLDESGYSAVRQARSKVGEPRDVVRLGVVPFDPTVPGDSVQVRWIDLAESGDENTVPHGPMWSPDGSRAIVQYIGEDHEDVWITEVDLEAATATVLTHDHDDAWIGGPPVQSNYLQPSLLAWLPDGSLAFASERSGWSHLYRLSPDGAVTALTDGPWEVRGASLSPDHTTWLLQASREHPAEDHLYTMPALGGPMERITAAPGRHEGWWSPDGSRLAVVSSSNTALPDLFMGRPRPGLDAARVTVSGTDAYYEHPLVAPEIVSFTHPDGGPLWAALYEPGRPNAQRSAVLHIHGGGYRQFAHRGYSVYGWALHLGFIHYLLEQGYTVLDFDYRGSAGFGRDYRTDMSESMGISDTDGAVAAARWLAETRNVDAGRIGIYGVSYGGFLTLTSLFRYPGVFAAGIARAAVTDWAHYSDSWTSRILGVPYENPEAYRRSSPIYYAEGLADPLLITHGLVDDNVHFQDAARLIQRLVELEKSFEVMVYPVEPHTVQTEASRYDLLRRQSAFFDENLRGGG